MPCSAPGRARRADIEEAAADRRAGRERPTGVGAERQPCPSIAHPEGRKHDAEQGSGTATRGALTSEETVRVPYSAGGRPRLHRSRESRRGGQACRNARRTTPRRRSSVARRDEGGTHQAHCELGRLGAIRVGDRVAPVASANVMTTITATRRESPRSQPPSRRAVRFDPREAWRRGRVAPRHGQATRPPLREGPSGPRAPPSPSWESLIPTNCTPA